MTRAPLKTGSTIIGDREYTIDSVAGDGVTCIVYAAHYVDSLKCFHNVLLKECYPYSADITRNETTLIWADNSEAQMCFHTFEEAYRKLMQFQNTAVSRNSTAAAFQIFYANGTVYSVVNRDIGVTYDHDNKKSMKDHIETALALTKAVQHFHDNGYLHLDIKPSNFLVIEETRQFIRLFDFDTVMLKADVLTAPFIPFSEGWSAPEQCKGQRSKICEATDLYAVGAILFEKIMGRKITAEDCGVFSDWSFDLPIFENVNPKIKRLLRTIFRKTFAINVSKRYQKAEELILALEEAVATASERQYIISSLRVSSTQFVGRAEDLQAIHEQFQSGARAVFVHGFRGLGKTELAVKYTQLYKEEYDAAVFLTYANGLEAAIHSIPLSYEEEDVIIVSTRPKEDKIRELIKKQKTLLVIDNFDVDDDPFLQELLTYECQILFTTRNDFSEYFSSAQIAIHEIGTLSTSDLLQIFTNSYGRNLDLNETAYVSQIIEGYRNWTYSVPIIAKQIIASGISIEEYARRIEKDGLFKTGEDAEMIRININGILHKKTTANLIRYLFNVAALSQPQKTALLYIHLLTHYHKCLTKEEYRKYTGARTLNALNDLLFLGWVSEDAINEALSIHPALRELIDDDMPPSCENVPGIYGYICYQIDHLEICKTVEEARALTFALLLYSDINGSDDRITQKHLKLARFYLSHYYEDPDGIYSLFCYCPKESAWHINPSWVIKILRSALHEYLKDSGNSPIEHRKLAFVVGLSAIVYLEKAGGNDNQTDISSIIIAVINRQISVGNIVCANYVAFSYAVRNSYLPRCGDNTNTKQAVHISKSNCTEFLEQARTIQHLLQVIVGTYDDSEIAEIFEQFDYFDNLHIPTINEMFNLLDRFIYLIDMYMGKAAYWGRSHEAMLTYRIPSNDEFLRRYANSKQVRSAKRVDAWFSSFVQTLQEAPSQSEFLKDLFSCNSQKAFISDAKMAKIADSGIISTIFFAGKLTPQERVDLFVRFIPQQVKMIRRNIGRWQKIPKYYKKHPGQVTCYYQATALATLLLNGNLESFSAEDHFRVIESLFFCKKAIGSTEFNIASMLMYLVKPENWEYLPLIARYSNFLGWRAARPVKDAVLDCWKSTLDANSDDFVLIYLDYELHAMADYYKRDDILEASNAFLSTPDKQHHLLLLSSDLVMDGKKQKIAKEFLEGYIHAILLYYRSQVLEDNSIAFPEAYESAFNNYQAVTFQCLNTSGIRLNNIYGIDLRGEPLVHHLSPFWLSELFSPRNVQLAEGLCYFCFSHYKEFLAQKNSTWDHLVEVLLEVIECHPLPDRSSLDAVIKNVIKLCPEAESHILEYDLDGDIQENYAKL